MKASEFSWCGTVPDQAVFEEASKIKLLLMDVDGVLTDGKVFYVSDQGEKAFETKGFYAHDGLGFNFLNSLDIETGFITGRDSQAVEEYAKNKRVRFLYQGNLEKIPILEEILTKASLGAKEVAYIGDDFTDVPILKRVGLACVVANAREEVKMAAHFVTQAKGGEGAVREVMELILKARGDWHKLLKHYSLIS
jgi:3-deoxy-D-manno-octulosonate 8-phosphate phosphatase (KDO 8-P phosphatase)